jgi:hypothetical protein
MLNRVGLLVAIATIGLAAASSSANSAQSRLTDQISSKFEAFSRSAFRAT